MREGDASSWEQGEGERRERSLQREATRGAGGKEGCKWHHEGGEVRGMQELSAGRWCI